MNPLISVETADRLLREHHLTTPPVQCPLPDCAGRTLQQPVVADRPLPPFHRVMMDGYAVRWSSDINTYWILQHCTAGETRAVLPSANAAATEIMTGAPLPEGADTIIPYENTRKISPDSFSIADASAVVKGQYIHRKASDYEAGTILLREGTRIGPVETGIAASCGYATLLVSQLPRIQVFGSGNELVEIDATPADHQIRRSNASAIATALTLAGFPANHIGHLADNSSEQKHIARAITQSDLIILSGAVSMGSHDWIPAALNGLADCIFHGVAQRPGKPMGFWKTPSGTAIFALPGNPVSTLVALHRYVIPYLRSSRFVTKATTPLPTSSLPTSDLRLPPSDFRPPVPPIPPALSPNQLHSSPFPTSDFRLPTSDLPLSSISHLPSPRAPARQTLTLFTPVHISSDGSAIPCPTNNSGDFARLAGTDGFIEIPPGDTPLDSPPLYSFYPWQK